MPHPPSSSSSSPLCHPATTLIIVTTPSQPPPQGAFGYVNAPIDTAKGAFGWQIIHQGVCLVGQLHPKGVFGLAV
ncbi:hypothetical protein Tco_0719923 [Tanacetum coccineum]